MVGNNFVYGTDTDVTAKLPSVSPDEIFSQKLLSIAYRQGRYWVYQSKDFTVSESLRCPSDQPWISLKHLNPISIINRYHSKYGYKLK
jgi:hypothetical protein